MNHDKLLESSKILWAEIRKKCWSQAILEQCLAQGADINYQSDENGYTALMLAVDKDDESLIHYLLQQGANLFIKNHHQKIASDLAITHSPIYSRLKNHELIAAVRMDDKELVKKALAVGADINYQGVSGYTAIMVAVKQGNLEIIELLVPYKPNFYRKNDEGYTINAYINDNLFIRETGQTPIPGETINPVFNDNRLIRKTLQVGKPLTMEEKKRFSERCHWDSSDEEDRREQGYLNMLAEKQRTPFSLNQLQFSRSKPAASEEEIKALQDYIGHPLPALYKDICRFYNGGRPKRKYYDDDELDKISYFFHVTSQQETVHSIWDEISNYSSILSTDVLPFASGAFNQSVFYFKWEDGKAQVWRYVFASAMADTYVRIEDQERYNAQGYVCVFINQSFQGFLESLYAVE